MDEKDREIRIGEGRVYLDQDGIIHANPIGDVDEEMEFVVEIFKVKHFQSLIRKKEQLEGTPVADPFVIKM
jgi:hypothetical protein